MREESARPGTGGARTLPINVLLKGRLCMLVGAGHVADRKCRNLLEHDAEVVLVAPEVTDGIRELEGAGRVTIRRERYSEDLLSELRPFLVYAATDDDALNRKVAADATERSILSSSASSWREGDFISPSLIPWGRGQVSVSTEGASCRQAKFMRLRLSELIGGERELLLLGVDLRTLSIEEFEKIRPDSEKVVELIGLLRHLAALEEFFLLATCNRLELYAFSRRDKQLLKSVMLLLGLSRREVYIRTGEEVIEHAANVVSGHYSQVACETQVTGQFKAAFRLAFEENVAGVHMQNLHDRALKLGKKIRALHGAGEEGLPELVAGMVRTGLPSAGPRVLVLGAGALGTEVAARLSGLGGIELSWANRTLGNLPESPPCRRLTLENALGRLGEFDQVVTVVGATAPVIRREHLEGLTEGLLLLDLGLPRNVEPSLAALPGIEILDLSHFRQSQVNRDQLLTLARTVAVGSGVVHG
jgi:glutamyl-tRNA reductase